MARTEEQYIQDLQEEAEINKTGLKGRVASLSCGLDRVSTVKRSHIMIDYNEGMGIPELSSKYLIAEEVILDIIYLERGY